MSPYDFPNNSIQLSLRTLKGYLPCTNLPQISPNKHPTFSLLKVLGFRVLKWAERTFWDLEESQQRAPLPPWGGPQPGLEQPPPSATLTEPVLSDRHHHQGWSTKVLRPPIPPHRPSVPPYTPGSHPPSRGAQTGCRPKDSALLHVLPTKPHPWASLLKCRLSRRVD